MANPPEWMSAIVRPRLFLVFIIFIFLTTIGAPPWLVAQTTGVLTGTVTDNAGKTLAQATVAAKNVISGQSVTATTDSTGAYHLSGLAPGEYEVSISKQDFGTVTKKVTIAAGSTQAVDVRVESVLSVESLGFPTAATQTNAAEQARLDRRSHMLKTHQRLGLITTIPLAATLFTGNLAGGKDTSSTGRNVHAVLGTATAGLYFTSASYAIFAPKIAGTKPQGPIRLHKALAWVHGPGMILTPILGAMAYQQKSDGQRVHGIASAHGAVAYTTAIAYGVSILSVSIHSRSKSVRDTSVQP